MDKVTQHIDMSQHACIQLEKATQFITQALQHEVGRNHELCVVICRLEEKGAEQLESIHQLNLKIVELQKHLEQKDNSLSKAYETVTFLTTELRDLHLHLRSTNPSSPFKSGQQATVDEPMISPVAQSPLVSSSLHGPRLSSNAEEPLVLCAQHTPPVVNSVSGQHSPPVFSRADTPLVSSFPHGFPVSSSDADPLFSSGQCSLSVSSSPVPGPLVPCDEHVPPEVGQVHSEAQSLMVVSATERLVEAVLSGFKTEAAFEEAEYGHRGYTQSELTSHPRPEQTFSSDADGKAELPQELEAESNMADTDNSDTDESDTEESDSDEPPPAPVSLAQLKRVSVVLVDCCGQKQQGKDEDHNQDGEMAVIGNGSSLSSMDLSESLSTSHAQIDSNEKYSCSVCGKSYQFHSQLRKHLYTHTQKCQYSCSHCGKTFNHKGNYKVHLRVHTGEKPYHCTQCDKRFAQGSSLKSHLRNHTGERPYSCALCGKGFSQKVNLTAHCCAPKNETLYHCAQCGQSFNDEKYLTEHQCSLTGDGPSQGCTQNDGSSTGRSARQKRQRTRTGVKLLDWTDCDKKFALNSSLTLHSRTHTGERPYQCTHCGKRFASKSYLDVHLRIHTGEKPYSCSVCGKAFNQLSNLKSHLFTHTKDWPHKCNQCGKGFTRPGLLKQHKCTHVGESGDAVV